MGNFAGERQPRAEKWLSDVLAAYQERSPALRFLDRELLSKTSTQLFDWIDHVIVEGGSSLREEIITLGFGLQECTDTYEVFFHHTAHLPAIIVRKQGSSPFLGVSLKVESVADFLMVWGIHSSIEGEVFSPFRRSLIGKDGPLGVYVAERKGTWSMVLRDSSVDPMHYLEAQEKWQIRPRKVENEREGLKIATALAQEITETVGRDVAAYLILKIEREYWQVRNTAAQIQRLRQDRLGLGWANHDHHVFHSSREHFRYLVKLFEILGFHCSERIYSDGEALWGGVIMENSTAGLSLLLMLDLWPDEIAKDFAHEPLPQKDYLGTIGLWCGLHGDSILHAGMHHLQARFHFETLHKDLGKLGISMMEPFSKLSYLKESFTQGEIWQVSPMRVEKLLLSGSITQEEADHFLNKGAIGSHLENVQRKEGFKGYHREKINTIISKTNPRIHHG